jgi:alpha-glucosidase
MRLFATILAIFLSVNALWSQKSWTLQSPDGSLKVEISLKDSISYNVYVDDKLVMKNCAFSMVIENQGTLGVKPRLLQPVTSKVNGLIKPVIKQKTSTITNHYNELVLALKGNYSVIFRAYDNGLAYRFESRFKPDIKVLEETNNFYFAGKAKVFFPEEKSFLSHNERSYLYLDLDSITEERFGSLPTLIEPADGPKILITESDLVDYPGMWLTGSNKHGLSATFPHYPLKTALREGSDRTEEVSEIANYLAVTQGTRSFPWRILMIARDDGDLITNQLTYLLAGKLQLPDVSWIKPGKVAWDWWNANNIYSVDFEAGINTNTYKYYIDFAAKYGLEYIILDEGWYELGDLLKVVPEINIEELVAYGKEKNVGIILWVVWKTLDEQLDEAMTQFEKWGIKGLKVDFMQRDDQAMVNYYHHIAKEAAKRKLLVDFHGAYKPSGLRRVYPNVMTREGVKGLEHNKWGAEITPEHNVTIPFIRMAAGPIDYTPGAMINAQPENFKAIWNRPMSMGTRCHQLAMYVVYESPLQMLADNPSNYLREAECTEFIAKVPVVWDDTRVLAAKVGDYIGLARKSGSDWFIGFMGDEEARAFTVDFSFLETGAYTIEYFADGTNAHRYASDYKKVRQKISSDDELKIKLAPGGGWAARISKD